MLTIPANMDHLQIDSADMEVKIEEHDIETDQWEYQVCELDTYYSSGKQSTNTLLNRRCLQLILNM